MTLLDTNLLVIKSKKNNNKNNNKVPVARFKLARVCACRILIGKMFHSNG